MLLIRSLLAIVLVGFVGSSCTTTSPDSQAQQLTLQELTESPGYAWFPAEMTTYTPRAPYVAQVAANFDAQSTKVCVFVRPSCSCTGTQKLFPQVIKTLMAAGVNMDNVEIWSMRSITDTHPYQSVLAIDDLPEIWILRDGAAGKHIVEAQYQVSNPNADSLLAAALVP
ncbi:MAG: hypothetical protein ACO3I4_07945 [Candidatus Kapaibacteriota bacterium]|jgi:hypothetical protein